MLVLTRRVDEKLTLHTSDGMVTIVVCKAEGGSCRIGIDAPKSVQILRDNAKDRRQHGNLPEDR